MKTNLNINYEKHFCYNELKTISIDNVIYLKNSLKPETIELLTILTYIDKDEQNVDLYYKLAKEVLGYKKIITTLEELCSLGYNAINLETLKNQLN